ncbi:Uma2 family endonuclease [Nonomuraea sp. 3-1Str]|uniref:Uma2 family endonuclease n=1 Tax=Nonomuraea sp. 3-1Str TaxID=2929801 RepID=UPI0028546CFD|nr:Uma2 family endonuclease [Nonomuraea sp. 3-1Str]MDR8414327.1 Uma2 family endonuclease [Nonomuraea sp. 3-1Str]
MSSSDLRILDVAVVSADATETASVTFSPREVRLAVDLISPNNGVLKGEAYAAAGIPVYWRVEMNDGPTVYVHELDGRTYGPPVAHKAGTVAELHAPFPVSFDPADLLSRRG